MWRRVVSWVGPTIVSEDPATSAKCPYTRPHDVTYPKTCNIRNFSSTTGFYSPAALPLRPECQFEILCFTFQFYGSWRKGKVCLFIACPTPPPARSSTDTVLYLVCLEVFLTYFLFIYSFFLSFITTFLKNCLTSQQTSLIYSLWESWIKNTIVLTGGRRRGWLCCACTNFRQTLYKFHLYLMSHSFRGSPHFCFYFLLYNMSGSFHLGFAFFTQNEK